MWGAEFRRPHQRYELDERAYRHLIGLRSQSGLTNYSEWACNHLLRLLQRLLHPCGSSTDRKIVRPTKRRTPRRSPDVMPGMEPPGYNFRGLNNQKITYKNKGRRKRDALPGSRRRVRTRRRGLQQRFLSPGHVRSDQTIADAFDPADSYSMIRQSCAIRNAGKWRETVYESKCRPRVLYDDQFPIPCYADVADVCRSDQRIRRAPGRPCWAEAIRKNPPPQASGTPTRSQLSDYRSFRRFVRNERDANWLSEGLRNGPGFAGASSSERRCTTPEPTPRGEPGTQRQLHEPPPGRELRQSPPPATSTCRSRPRNWR